MHQITFVMVDMNDRLAQFMRSEQLTAAKLAEIVQVQPSSISHLLSGRNKPNFDFVARIMRMFPELNPDWLINGIGAMYRKEEAKSDGKENLVTNMHQTEPNLFHSEPEQQGNQMLPLGLNVDTNVTAQDIAEAPQSSFAEEQQRPAVVVDPAFVAQTPAAPLSALAAPPVGRSDGSLAGVRQVVLLFDDHTCSVYQHRDQ